MARRKRNTTTGETGSLWVEMSITLPMYLFVVAFTIDVIRLSFTAAMVQYAADNAAFCGARVHLTEAGSQRFAAGKSSAEFREAANSAAYRASVCQEEFPDVPSLEEPQGYLGYALKNLRQLQLSNGRDVQIGIASPLWESAGNGSCWYLKRRDGTITLTSKSGVAGSVTTQTHADLSTLPLCAGGDGGLGVLSVGVRYKTLLDRFMQMMGLPRPQQWIWGYGVSRNELPYV